MPRKNSLGTCIVIAGPTASGKSWLAEELAKRVDGIIINGDSMQVYKGLQVTTAQPEPETHHRLYSCMQPHEACSAAHWRKLALEEIHTALSNNKVPIVVGGTGLYLKALTEGISSVPDIPHGIRQASRDLCEELGPQRFHQKLAAIDPLMAAKLNPNDTQRMTRAYEVMKATGKSLLHWQEMESGTQNNIDYVKVLILPPKAELDERIAERFSGMLHKGAITEVQMLGNLPHGSPALKAIGIPEIKAYLQGTLTLEQAQEKAIISSRQLAKRQSTWFRHQLQFDHCIKHIPQIEDVKTLLESL